jgi:hypothetical protein
MSQFISNSSLFIQQTLKFESKLINNEQIQVPIPDAKFGILNLIANTITLSQEEFEFVFEVDCSGSMGDKCQDGRPKMQHINHTLKNIVTYLKENNIKAFITVRAFDNNIHNIIDHTDITDENYSLIIAKIEKIIPRNSTNIELAIQDINCNVEYIKEKFPGRNISAFLLTDGAVTAGSSDYSILAGLVNRSITNVFMGFGNDHDEALLGAISNGENSAYYFIDKLENAGFIYGEALNGILYKLLRNVEITVQNGLIYNFKNNTWGENLYVGNIVSEVNKFYHIASSANPTECTVLLTGTTISDSTDYQISILGEESDADITNFIYRQRTLQFLYTASNLIKNHNIPKKNNRFCSRAINYIEEEEKQDEAEEAENLLKENLIKFIEEMKKYMDDNNLNDDKFMKNLCDDIYISHESIGTKFANMFINARQTSQGNQRLTTISSIPDEDNDCPSAPRRLQHQISDSNDLPYLTSGATQIMRACSRNVDDDATTCVSPLLTRQFNTLEEMIASLDDEDSQVQNM